ncbi:MAG: hypothetical protein KTR31_10735 [Myxococcales bacterium]|nr:hypothetical protein [Myxococcales bacterium]
MRIHFFAAIAVVLALGACDSLGEVGDACEVDADCVDGLECHVEEEEEEGTEEEEHEHEGHCEEHEDEA